MTDAELPRPLGSTRERGIRHVLVCLDRSRLAEACLPHARFVADAFDARMTLLNVLASPEGDQPSTRPDALDWELTRREAEQYLLDVQFKLEEQGVARQRVTSEVTQGRPAERIVALARTIGADLIVLSNHGEGGVGPSNLGSTTQQVLALAPSSVLVVPPDFGAARNVPPKRVVVAVDGSLRTQSVLPDVAQLARFHDAEVLLLHVVAEPKPTAILCSEEDLALARSLASRQEAGARTYLSQIRQRLFPEVRSVDTLVLKAMNERRALVETAEQRQADLLVLAAHGATCDAERPFGSVTTYVLSHGRLPLLVLQDVPARERESFCPYPEARDTPTSVRSSIGLRSLEEN